jgi:sugar-specific transcriptional regulator TrmB
MVDEIHIQQLTALGLNKYEACAYLALLGHHDSSAVEVADRAGVPRQRVYDVLESLRERGLIVLRDGRPTRYTARQPGIALAELLAARRLQQETENQRLAAVLEDFLGALGPAPDGKPEALAPRVPTQEPVGGF